MLIIEVIAPHSIAIIILNLMAISSETLSWRLWVGGSRIAKLEPQRTAKLEVLRKIQLIRRWASVAAFPNTTDAEWRHTQCTTFEVCVCVRTSGNLLGKITVYSVVKLFFNGTRWSTRRSARDLLFRCVRLNWISLEKTTLRIALEAPNMRIFPEVSSPKNLHCRIYC